MFASWSTACSHETLTVEIICARAEYRVRTSAHTRRPSPLPRLLLQRRLSVPVAPSPGPPKTPAPALPSALFCAAAAAAALPFSRVCAVSPSLCPPVFCPPAASTHPPPSRDPAAQRQPSLFLRYRKRRPESPVQKRGPA
ncbi:hypothetical protein GRF29_69g2094910 [Pseudopithomyces chartarum]|uniref:Uncharacterized protein n=1 Tax=Pseudopithomyces chartarum TaxID=1892770 RepID=A0AAN6LXE8_9PLEO|nr:hypothetical protein GRF29_69g2094910 [Pseudopithomyces chartarum]